MNDNPRDARANEGMDTPDVGRMWLPVRQTEAVANDGFRH